MSVRSKLPIHHETSVGRTSARCGLPLACVGRGDVEVTDARNVESQIAFEVSDRRARGTVVPTAPGSFLSSEMNAQAEG
jgi:hypothetical protein